MKKVVAILLAGVLTVGCSMTAFAAESPTGSTAVSKGLEDVSSSDDNVSVGEVAEDAEGYDAAVEINADDSNTELANYVDNADDYTLTYLVDVTVDEAAITDGSYTVTLAVDVTADDDVVVLHYVDGAWELVASTVGDGYVTFTLTNFSPVAIYVASADTESDEESSTTSDEESSTTSDDDSETSDDSDDDETTSDETGEANVMLYVVMIAVIAAAGMAVSSKKRRA